MKNYVFKLVFLSIILLGIVFLALSLGSIFINIFDLSRENLKIIFQLRLTRVIFAGLAGASLAMCGLLFQALLQNPLAEPYLLGVSAGGALGGVFSLLLGSSNLFLYAVAGSLLALLVVFIFASRQGKIDNVGLILSGVMVNAFCSALIMLIVTLGGSKVNSMMFWLMGDIGSARLAQAAAVLPVLILVIVVCAVFSKKIDALSLGEEQAGYLGVDAKNLKLLIFILSSLLTGLVVATVGIIGFIGLVIPHIARLLTGEQTGKLLPMVIVLGMAFTIFADLLSRTIVPDIVLPIGIITALCGVPFFIFIYKKY